jgi:hypothetical protein
MKRLSLEDFKKWIAEQKQPVEDKSKSLSKLIGLAVESKISAQRLAVNINSYDGNLHEICEDFRKNGGKIADIKDHEFLIEVTTGGFYIKRCFVKKRD